jgi:uroporphyrinogen-III decarboxylase
VETRASRIRAYYADWRRRVGEDGVIVIGHPNPAWLAFQISQSGIFLHWTDHRETYLRSVEAIYRASLFVMEIAMSEGIDFMSASGLGLEMTSPALFGEMDLPILRRYADWTHRRGGSFWYHNCGRTRRLIEDGLFNRIGADVLETLAPPPNGDNDLAEARLRLDPGICTKGNLDLGLLREGTPEQVTSETRRMVRASRGFPHIHSTADAVLPGTPAENMIAFVTAARREADHA